jgi:hypothetical protein
MPGSKATAERKTALAHWLFSLACGISLFFILPRFGVAAVAACAAAILSVYVLALPERFRSRGGSLKPAFFLVVAMWIVAAVMGALSVSGAL